MSGHEISYSLKSILMDRPLYKNHFALFLKIRSVELSAHLSGNIDKHCTKYYIIYRKNSVNEKKSLKCHISSY